MLIPVIRLQKKNCCSLIAGRSPNRINRIWWLLKVASCHPHVSSPFSAFLNNESVRHKTVCRHPGQEIATCRACRKVCGGASWRIICVTWEGYRLGDSLLVSSGLLFCRWCSMLDGHRFIDERSPGGPADSASSHVIFFFFVHPLDHHFFPGAGSHGSLSDDQVEDIAHHVCRFFISLPEIFCSDPFGVCRFPFDETVNHTSQFFHGEFKYDVVLAIVFVVFLIFSRVARVFRRCPSRLCFFIVAEYRSS